MHMRSREGWRGRERAGSAGGRRARVASGGACGQKYFGGVRAYAGARGRAQGKYFLFFTVYFLRAFSHAFWRTEDRGRTEEDAVFVCSTSRKAQVRLRSASPS